VVLAIGEPPVPNTQYHNLPRPRKIWFPNGDLVPDWATWAWDWGEDWQLYVAHQKQNLLKFLNQHGKRLNLRQKDHPEIFATLLDAAA